MRKMSMNEFILEGIDENDTATVNALELHNLVVQHKLLEAKINSVTMDYERLNENNKMMCEANIELQAKIAILEDKLSNKRVISLGDIFDTKG